MNTILSDQNKAENIQLLKAQRVAYSNAKRVDTIKRILHIATLIAPFFLLESIESKIDWILIFAWILALLHILVYFWNKSSTKKWAVIQEMFDVSIYNMDRNQILCWTQIQVDEILSLSKKYKEDDLADWYPKTIVKELSEEVWVLLCQISNLFWDNGLRKKFIHLVWFFVFWYIVLILVLSLLNDNTLRNFFLILLPAIPSLTHFIIWIFKHLDIIKDKIDLKATLNQLLENYSSKKKILKKENRWVQDRIFWQRIQSEKVPNRFYYFYKDDMENDMAEYVWTLISKYDLTS